MALISRASKVMLKILQARLQQYVNHELPDVQAGFRKGKGTTDQIAYIYWIIEKARTFQKSIYFCFIDYAKVFDSVYHNKLWEILKEMGIPDHPTCLLRYLYAGQEATIRTGHGTTDWFQTGKERKENEVAQSCPTLCSSLHQAPPSMGFSRQEYWSGLLFPSSGNLPDPGIEPRSPAL